MNKNQLKQFAAVSSLDAGIVPSGKVAENKPAKKQITKQDIFRYILGSFTFVSMSYSGNDNTFYIRGVDAKYAELAVLKAFPGMPFKTQSNTAPVTRDAKDWYFLKDGTAVNNTASNIVFECKARTLRNAKRKFGNFVESLTSGTITGAVK